MILPALIKQHLRSGDDPEFYRLQARDAIRWLGEQGVRFGPEIHAIDLGAGHGIFGAELLTAGCRVSFADEQNYLLPELQKHSFRAFDIDRQPLSDLGRYDLVICSNVLEHLAEPKRLLTTIQDCLNPGGWFYLSWTNWLSPWGGHEFSPFHYLGPALGPKVADRLTGKVRKHTPFVNLFPTSIGDSLRTLRSNRAVRVAAMAPRYYTEFSFLCRIPIAREFLSWNCALLIQRI
jgi:SAM-dependent methyltransferase